MTKGPDTILRILCHGDLFVGTSFQNIKEMI